MATAQPPRTPLVYEPTETGLPLLRPYLRDLWARRNFMWHLARTDLKAEHYDTALGQLWIVLDPLLMAAVYYLLRTVVRPAGSSGVGRNALIAHVLWGVFFFTFTSNCLTAGARSVMVGKGLVLNASFPRALLPLVAIIKASVDFVPTFVVYLAFHAWLGQPFTVALLVVPILFALQTVFGLGLALLFAPLMVFYRDTGGFLPYLTRLWLYLTPVLYLVSEIPPNLRPVFLVNPLYPFFGALGQIFVGAVPSPWYLLGAAAWAFVTFFVGAVLFLAREREFAVRL
jgi:teichoic acid transport system permease protein